MSLYRHFLAVFWTGFIVTGIRAAPPVSGLSRSLSFPMPDVRVTAEGHTRVSVAGCAADMQTAEPVLPAAGATFDIPAGFIVAAVTVSPAQIQEIALAAPLEWGRAPCPPDGPVPPDPGPDPAVYGGTDVYPDTARPVWRTDPSGDTTRLSVQVFPVRFDPAHNLLLAAAQVEITVTLRASPVVKSALGMKHTSLSAETPHTYVILSTSNLINAATAPWDLQSLCDTRAAAGFTPAVVDVDWIYSHYDGANSPARIRAFVQDAHQQWGTRYLLIVGTYDLIPAQKLHISISDILSTTTAAIPSDAVYYGCIDGPYDNNGNGLYGEVTDGTDGGDVDLTAEVLVGRFPVATPAELANMVRKTLRYENATPAETVPNVFMSEQVNFGSVVYSDGYMDELRFGSATGYATLGFENSEYAGLFDTSDTLYDSSNALWSASDALAFLNRNLHTVSHIGHGASAQCAKISLATSSDLDALRAFTNTMPYFMYSQACYSGAFDGSNCFAEQLVTVSNAAFAAVMNARNGWEFLNTVDGYSHRFHRCFWDAALSGTATRLGEISEASRAKNLYLISTYAASYWRYVYYELNLFGDPATPFAPSVNRVAPVIDATALGNTFDTQTVYRVACTLTPIGIYDPASVALVWQTDRAPGLCHTQFMTRTEGNLFETDIEPQPAPTRIAYTVTAANRAGCTSRWPETGDAVFHVTQRFTLSIEGAPSAYGAVSPDYGAVYYASGEVATVSAPIHVAVDDDTRWTSTGFSGTGCVPQSGANQTVSFQMDTDSTLTWAWQREYRLTVSSADGLFATRYIWEPEGNAYPVPALAPVLTNSGITYAFAEWRLDGSRSPAAPGYCDPSYGGLVMDSPHTLEAVYLPETLDADGNGIPDWWETRYYGTNGQDADSDEDGDGWTLAEEYADRTSPLDSTASPAPPVIVHTPLAATQAHPGPFTIQAVITDTHRVADAFVWWRKNNDKRGQNTPMTAISNDTFEAVIGEESAPGDQFVYRIFAVDPDGRTNQTDTSTFFLCYPVLDTSRLHDLTVVALPTQNEVSNAMDVSNAGNDDLVWTMRLARVESVLDPDLRCWNRTSIGQRWTASTNRYASPPYSLHSTLTSCGLSSGPAVHATISLPPLLLGTNAVLTFHSWIRSEVDSTEPDRAFDGGLVEYSTDGGATFRQLDGPYTHTIYGWTHSPWTNGTPCFAGAGTSGWQNITFDLASVCPEENGFFGQNVIFRFHYAGDNNTDWEGWYIDDVTVSPLLSRDGFTNDLGSACTGLLAASAVTPVHWVNRPSEASARDDNVSVLFLSNDPANPVYYFYWNLKIRDAPRLPGFSAVQSADGDGLVSLASGVFDEDGEPVNLAVQWSPDNGQTWQDAALTNLAAAFGGVPTQTLSGVIDDLPTSQDTRPTTNRLSGSWASRATVPPVTVNTQVVFRITATNGYYGTVLATGPVTVDNVAPVFQSGTLTGSPMSSLGDYALTSDGLTLSWPVATDTPSTNLLYRLTDDGAAHVFSTASGTLSLSNRLDAVHSFQVVALDPAGNASGPLDTTLLVLDALADFDGDGMTSADEETAGTCATNAADRLAAALSPVTTDGSLRLSWTGETGRLYTVETTPTLSPPDWQPLPGGADLAGAGEPLTLALPTTNSASFFRIRVRLP